MKQSWHDFALAEPELSAFGEDRLKVAQHIWQPFVLTECREFIL